MTTSARLQTIEEIFHSARELEPATRTKFLKEACAGDTQMCEEIEALLRSSQEPTRFSSETPSRLAAELLNRNERGVLVGRTFGHYELLECLGAGGMGEVYVASDTRSGRKAALKVLPAPFTTHAERLRRFRQEAQTVIALNHPNIVTIYEIGEHESGHYIVSELIEGETLRERLRRGPLPLDEALEIAIQCASALAAAHDAGVVHRDIKPENIMLRRDGYVKVLDFGIAKLAEDQVQLEAAASADGDLGQTRFGSVLGTARYMSPEQARGETVDGRTDIWSLGVVLYEMITGAQPFGGATTKEIAASILERAPTPLRDVEFRQVVTRALTKDRQQRFASAGEMVDALKSARRGRELQTERPAHRTAYLGRFALAAAVVISAAVSAFYWSRDSQPNRAPPTQDISRMSIAVLPFRWLGEDKTDEYLGFGLADALVTKLSNVKKLAVRSPNAARAYETGQQDALAAARALHADVVLEGSAQKSGNRLRVTVRMLNVKDGAVMWSDAFDQDFTNILEVQDAISTRVTSALPLRLTPAEQTQLGKRYTANADAYKLYLEGRYAWSRASIDDFKKAEMAYRAAIALDPSYALAYAGLADLYDHWTSYVQSHEKMDACLAAARRAVELDDQLSETHTALGTALLYSYDWAGAEQEYRRALELNPNNVWAHLQYCQLLALLEQTDEGLAELERLQEIDPTYRSHVLLPWLYNGLRQHDRAIEIAQKLIAANPKHAMSYGALGNAYAAKKLTGEAIKAYEQTANLADTRGIALYCRAAARALTGNVVEVRSVIGELEQVPREEQIWPTSYASIYALIGDRETAFAWLERAYAERDPWLRTLRSKPVFDSLRTDPRFIDLLRRVNLLR